MGIVRGYGDLLLTANTVAHLKGGVLLDTNVLVAATYPWDSAHGEARDFGDYLSELEIPKFCNVNARFEFLEIYRRILFTSALLGFNTGQVENSENEALVKKIHSLKTRSAKAKAIGKVLRLSENEIKEMKLLFYKHQISSRNAWLVFCENHIGSDLDDIWQEVEDELGVNFLSLRAGDGHAYMETAPDWRDVTKFMSSHGLSSSDAMILNIFLSSKFVGLVSSDIDLALSFKAMTTSSDKILFVPDRLLKKLN